ncbi:MULTISPECIES: class I SAM-dependent methyltransferase [Gimesia]|nr:MULTISPECIES: class I SAM-dependent methyltransferase [Gimesia]QDT21972.1 Methyltransferase domain protein [Gimesia chilikensis]|tara:strand:+ start:1697 stop:2353 length:657 start_codon:yes stop_codon:yes gene_type:complete
MKAAISRLCRKLTIKTFSRKTKLMLERFKGVDFLTVIQPEEIGYDPHVVYRSSPSGNKYLIQLLKDISVTNADSIIDIGSGKGSAMRSMLKFPFAEIAGIELSEQIAAIAINNFKKLRANRCHVFSCDATAFQNYGHYNMFYFYNPFPADIMSEVICKIDESARGSDKEILIIYNNPVYHDSIISFGAFSKVKEYPDEWGNQIFLYSNKSLEHSRLNR